MANPSTGTTGSATLIPNHRSDPADFGPLGSYLEQAAWSRLNQARGVFVTHMDPHNQEAVEKAWETALMTMADKIRGGRIRANMEAMAKLIREAYVTDRTDVENQYLEGR